jgi:hypothetical protein
MNIEKLNPWLTLLANIGVIAGIVFLAFEIRQNTTATELDAASNYEAALREYELFVAGNPDFTEIIVKSIAGKPLTEIEQFRVHMFFRGALRNWQTAYFQYQLGALDEPIWESQLGFMKDVIRSDGGVRDFWRSNQDVFTDDFNRLFQHVLDEVEAE